MEKKYKKFKWNILNDEKLNKIIENFIKEKKLILYGGLAIDMLIKKNSKLHYYDEYDLKDYDVFSTNFIDDSNDLANILSSNGYKKIAIKTGITGKTRKIFINFNYEAIIDISQIDKNFIDNIKIIKINNFRIAEPNYLKIDQYKNVTSDLFRDYFRFQKSYRKILLLEKVFPINEKKMISKKTKINVPDLSDHEYLIGGDFALNKYYNFEINDVIIIFSNTIFKEYLPDYGKKYKKNIYIFPLNDFGTFYEEKENIKISSKIHLLYTYYVLKFWHNVSFHDWKITLLFNDDSTFKKRHKILIPENKIIKKKIKRLPTTYID
jgi:hypothetical protein